MRAFSGKLFAFSKDRPVCFLQYPLHVVLNRFFKPNTVYFHSFVPATFTADFFVDSVELYFGIFDFLKFGHPTHQ